MSTFEIDTSKIIDWLFPESNWNELEDQQYGQVLEKLSVTDSLKSEVADYLRVRNIRIGFHEQYRSGAGWTFLRSITLKPGKDPLKSNQDLLNPAVLSLIVHETYHLKQSIWMRLSMQGELRAWQFQKRMYPSIANGNEIGAEGDAYSGTKEHWDVLDRFSPDSREHLEWVRDVMKRVAKGYRSDRLPLYPLPQEIGFHLKRGDVIEAVKVVLNLLRGNN